MSLDKFISNVRATVLSKCQQIWSNADETTEIGVAIINIVDELADFVENIPLADVQSVKHGRWIPQGDDLWLCSNCKENIIYSMHKSDRTEKQRYCCRCGARMDGDIE